MAGLRRQPDGGVLFNAIASRYPTIARIARWLGLGAVNLGADAAHKVAHLPGHISELAKADPAPVAPYGRSGEAKAADVETSPSLEQSKAQADGTKKVTLAWDSGPSSHSEEPLITPSEVDRLTAEALARKAGATQAPQATATRHR